MSAEERFEWQPGDVEWVDESGPRPPAFGDVAEQRAMGPAARGHIQSLIDYYMKKPHPFTECVRDNTKRFGPEGAKRVCATLKDIGEGTTKWRK